MDNPHPLRAYRENHEPKLSQGQLATKLSVARETVARWEGGKRKIDDDKLPEVSRLTGIPREVLRPDLVALLGAAE
jgi:transcriptional regulator with XRE-family HTH domain